MQEFFCWVGSAAGQMQQARAGRLGEAHGLPARGGALPLVQEDMVGQHVLLPALDPATGQTRGVGEEEDQADSQQGAEGRCYAGGSEHA